MLIIKNDSISPDFNLTYTLTCGQCFEWELYKKGYAGVVNNIFLYLFQKADYLHIAAYRQGHWIITKNSAEAKGFIYQTTIP